MKLSMNFEGSYDEDVLNKTYLDTKLTEVKVLIRYIEKIRNDPMDHERYTEVFLIHKGVKTTIQKLNDNQKFFSFENG